MRSALAALVAAVTVAAGVVGAGCVIITGSTDGYSVKGSGDGGGDGGAAVSLACVSAADCGDGGNVCCLVIDSSSKSATTACQTSCTGAFPVQLCNSTPECGKTGGLCTKQTCNFGTSVTIWACGNVAGCTQ